MNGNDLLVDALLRHRLDLLRFEEGVAADVLAAFDAALADVLADLKVAEAAALAGRPLAPSTVRLLRQRRAAIDALVLDLVESLDGRLTAGILAGARFESLALRGVASAAGLDSVGVAWATPSTIDVLAAVDPDGSRPWSRLVVRHGADVRSSIGTGIARIVAGTASPESIAAEARLVLGVVEKTRGYLVGLTRTEMQRAANTAALAAYRSNLDTVRGVTYLATFDSRTCVICAPYHGRSFDFDLAGRLPDEAPEVPQHPRCRCLWSPRVRRWDELGLTRQRDAFDGQPATGPDFETFLRRNPATAREMLGPARFEAWSSGLPVEAFSDRRGALSLEDLRARYPAEFAA